MSKPHHAIYLTTIGGLIVVVLGLLTLSPVDQPEPASAHQLVVFPFGSQDIDSEVIAAELTSALIRSLEKVPNIEVVVASDLPADMRNPGDHHLWPDGSIVSLFVEGYVQSIDDGVKITAQLIDTSSNDHVWSSSYMGDRDVASEVVAAVEDQVVLIAAK